MASFSQKTYPSLVNRLIWLLQVGTDSEWLSHDATAFFGPVSATGGYRAPRENQNAKQSPGAWHLAGYKPPAGASWTPSVAQPDFPTNLTAKTGAPLSITTGVKVPVVVRVEGSAEPLFFFDQTSDVMGGIHLEVPPRGAKGYKYAEVTLSEELAGAYGSGVLLYPMRTGNTYRYTFTLDPAQRSVFDVHEYALYRYGTLRFTNAPSPSGPAGPPPPTVQLRQQPLFSINLSLASRLLQGI